MAEVAVGDELIGPDGLPTRVVAATTVMEGRPCFEVEFSDGTVIVADAEHQWLTKTRASRRRADGAGAICTTREIAATLRCPTTDRRLNHSVTNAAPLQGADVDLLVPPYTLGAWLGDGTSRAAQITTDDPEILMRIEGRGWSPFPHPQLGCATGCSCLR